MELGGRMMQSNLYPSVHDGMVAVNSLYNQGAIPSDTQSFAPKRRSPGTSPTTATWQTRMADESVSQPTESDAPSDAPTVKGVV